MESMLHNLQWMHLAPVQPHCFLHREVVLYKLSLLEVHPFRLSSHINATCSIKLYRFHRYIVLPYLTYLPVTEWPWLLFTLHRSRNVAGEVIILTSVGLICAIPLDRECGHMGVKHGQCIWIRLLLYFSLIPVRWMEPFYPVMSPSVKSYFDATIH